MARWSIVVWSGLALAALGLVIPGLISSTNRGSLFWIGLALIGLTGALAWLAANGNQRNRWMLLIATGVLTLLSVAAAVISLGLSLGQSPLIDLIGWPIAALGAALALVGSVMSLRTVESSA